MEDILQQLVACNTTYEKNNKDVLSYIIEYLDKYNFNSKLIPLVSDERLCSLVSHVDLGKDETIIFSGHIDVVTIGDIEDWKEDPFTLTKDNYYYYGRGVCDMKGQIATFLSILPEIIKKSKYNITLALSCDEETDLKSIKQIIEDIKKTSYFKNISHCVVMEPTKNKIGIGHNGVILGNVKITGIPAHSSEPQNGVSAIKYGIRVINILEKDMSVFEDTDNPKNSSFLNVGIFEGGEIANIIPGFSEIYFSIRENKIHKKDIFKVLKEFGEEILEIEKEMKEKNDKCSIDISYKEIISPFLCEDREGSISNKLELEKIYLNYGSEASSWSELGIDTIVLGGGDIKQAHTTNEYVSKKSLLEYKEILKEIMI